jgi:LacI family transcriptional regulator
MPNKKITVQDIANELSISRNTVSKALNNTGTLAEATKSKIIQKAIEMGYKQFAYINNTSQISSNISVSKEIALLTCSMPKN